HHGFHVARTVLAQGDDGTVRGEQADGPLLPRRTGGDAITVTNPTGLVLVHGTYRKGRGHGPLQGHLGEFFRELVQSTSRGKVIGAHPSTAQGGQMATCSQGHSHVTGQGADVGPTGTGDRRIDVEEGAVDVLPSTDRCDVELFHRHLTGLECDLLALTSRFVGTL